MAAADQSYDLKKEFGIAAENYPKFHKHFDGPQQKALIDEDIFAAKSVMAVLFGNLFFLILLLFLCFIAPGASDTVPAAVTVPSILYAFIVYNLMGYTYFHIYNMSETARRVRILYDINSKGRLKKADIEKFYHKGDMVAMRVERLLGQKQIKQKNGAYVLDARLLYYAALLLAFWSRLIGLSILPEGYRKNRQR